MGCEGSRDSSVLLCEASAGAERTAGEKAGLRSQKSCSPSKKLAVRSHQRVQSKE